MVFIREIRVEYTEPTLEVEGKPRDAAREWTSSGEGSYVLKNDMFEVYCSCTGDVGALVPVKEQDSLGAYVRPAAGTSSSEGAEEFHVSKHMVFARPVYTGASWVDADTTSGDAMLAWGRKRKQNKSSG